MEEGDDIQFLIYSTSSQQLSRSLLEEILRNLRQELIEQRLAEGDYGADGTVPKQLISVRRAVRFEPASLAIGLVLALGGAMGSWAVGRLCDAIFDKKIKPGLTRAISRASASLAGDGLDSRNSQSGGSKKMSFTLGLWFRDGRNMLLITVPVSEQSGFELTKETLAGMLQVAQSRGISDGQILSFRVSEGLVAGEPKIVRRFILGDVG